MKNKTTPMIQKKSSVFEYVTAFAVMTLVLYIFIQRGNSSLVTKVEAVDSTVQVTNEELKLVNDSIQIFFPYLRRINQDYSENLTKQNEILDQISNNNILIQENNQLLEKQNNYLKNIDKKQNIIIDNVQNTQSIDSFFRKKFDN
jgi:hypothetical protein